AWVYRLVLTGFGRHYSRIASLVGAATFIGSRRLIRRRLRGSKAFRSARAGRGVRGGAGAGIARSGRERIGLRSAERLLVRGLRIRLLIHQVLERVTEAVDRLADR